MRQGLSSTDALEKLKEFGYNELPAAKSKSVLGIALSVLKEPMFLLLLSCGLLYVLLGDYTEGIVLLSTIIIIIFITFYQYQKTEKALDALKKLSAPRVLVIRDNEEIRVPGREVVPGDLMILNEGDRVGADAHVLSSQNLTVDESLLTENLFLFARRCFQITRRQRASSIAEHLLLRERQSVLFQRQV